MAAVVESVADATEAPGVVETEPVPGLRVPVEQAALRAAMASVLPMASVAAGMEPVRRQVAGAVRDAARTVVGTEARRTA